MVSFVPVKPISSAVTPHFLPPLPTFLSGLQLHSIGLEDKGPTRFPAAYSRLLECLSILKEIPCVYTIVRPRFYLAVHPLFKNARRSFLQLSGRLGILPPLEGEARIPFLRLCRRCDFPRLLCCFQTWKRRSRIID